MKRVFDSPFLNKAALVLIWLLLMGGTFFYANKNYFLYHENPNLIKADGYYLYNFGSPRHYYWALPVKFTHEGKVYHSQRNRQIILRSGIKSLQPFERWSNLLQVTCDL